MNSALKRIINWVSNNLGGKQTEQSAPKKSVQVGTLPAFTQIVEGSNKLPERGRKLLNMLRVIDSHDGNATVKVYDLSPVIHYAVTSALQERNLLY